MENLDALVAAARAGDVEAYGEIVRRFQDMAYGCAYSVLGDTHLAEDATQEAFIEAYHALTKLADVAAFPGWFRRIVQHQCSRMTRGKRLPTVAISDAAAVSTGDAPPGQAAEDHEMKAEVLDALNSLPAAQREVTTLFYINGYSHQNIAEFLEVPVGTVKSRLYASRRRLKERMMSMVARGLDEAKPGSSFPDRVRQIILLRKRGLGEDALRMQESLLGLLKGMQRQGRYAATVSEHQAAMAAVRADGSDPRMWCQTYGLLSESYIKAGKARELAEALLAVIPAQPTPQETALWVGEAVGDLVTALQEAGDAREAAQQGHRLIDMLEAVIGDLDLEPWTGPRAPKSTAPVAELDLILRTGGMADYLAEAGQLLQNGQLEQFQDRVTGVLGLPEIILLGLPAQIETELIPDALQRRFMATHTLQAQARHEFCLQTAADSMALAERLRGHPGYRFHRVRVFLDELAVAVAYADQTKTTDLSDQLYAELEAGEQELAASCPGVRTQADAADDEQRHWCQCLGDAYMTASNWLDHFKLIAPAEALRLVRRAADLVTTYVVEEYLAHLLLSAEGNRPEALSHFRKARALGMERERLRSALFNLEWYAPVRDDPEFLAVVNP